MNAAQVRLSIFIAVLLLPSASPAKERKPLAASTQLLVVTTADWNSVEAILQLYQRSGASAHWRPAGEPITVVVGKNGLGWGSGVVPLKELRPDTDDPVKKEGDGKAPAGIFQLSSIFGYAEQKPREWKMPYVKLTPDVDCVDDPASRFYNRVLDRTQVSVDWNSSEHMRRPDDLYLWGVIVDHNADPPRNGAGSCIFLHIWRGAGQGTVGCTAMPQAQLERVLRWLDPKRKPILVQLPKAQYEHLKNQLALP